MQLKFIFALYFLFLNLHFNCNEQTEKPLKCIFVETGIASWYGPGLQGKKTASGSIFNMNSLTAAHKKLEFGTLIRVTNIKNQKYVIVEVVDRGPVSKKKVLDLSKKAAQEIDIIKSGSAEVKIEIVGYKEMNSATLIKHYRNIQIIKFGKIID